MSPRSGLLAALTALALLIAPTAAADPVEPPAPPTAVEATGALVVTGTARVGSTLLVTGPGWSPEDAETTYQWMRDNAPIPGSDAIDADYTLTAADVGRSVGVLATGVKEGYSDGQVSSTPIGPVTKIPATVIVSGTSPKVGVLKLTIRVAASEAVTGTVSIRQGTKLLKDKLKLTSGRVTYTRSGIKPGRNTYSVRYAGTTRVAEASKSAAVRIKAKTKPSIALKPTTSVGKVRIGIAVNAAGQPPLGGTAYVKEGSRTLKTTIKVVKGKAAFSASAKPGRHTYLIGYRGTSQVRPGSKSVTVRVPAPAKLVSYDNCAAMQRVHPHGVGRSGAKDKSSGTPVTTFLVNTKLYEYNDGKARKPGEKDLDRDNDGVACEKR